jgi:two-component system response regulator FlrC
LFLDEIGEMPLELQPKLLRLLQERKLTRIGGTREISVDVRIVAATNANLREDIRLGAFREDLYYRLSTFALRLPRLAERPRDIKALALLLLQKHACGRPVPRLDDSAIHCLLQHSWPGNVRELENVMARALIMCSGEAVTADDILFDEGTDDDLQACAAGAGSQPLRAVPPLDVSLERSTRNLEHRRIVEAMQDARCREEAATRLGISERTLRHKLQRMREQGLNVPKVYSR